MMNGKIYAKWKEFDYENPKHRERLVEALQFSFSYPDLFIPERFRGTDEVSKKFREKRKVQRAAMQAFATLQDFPTTPKEVIEKFHEIPLYDNGFEQIFDIRDYSGSRRDGFSMATVQSGLTFQKVLTGEKLKVYQMSGEKAYVYFDYCGGALNWHRSLFENQNYWEIEDNAIEFTNKAYGIRAATFYALLEAAAAHATKTDITLQAGDDALATGTRGWTASRDVATMNLAAETILLACQHKGYGISPQTATFVVLTPLQLRGRIRLAMQYQQDPFTGSAKHLDYNFQQITTTMLTVTDHYIVALPKKKLKAGYRMDLTTFTDFDILAYVDTVAGWMAYGGAVGDLDQIERCNTA